MLRFLAVIPSTSAALRVHGEGGARLTLDIDEGSLRECLPGLLQARECLLVVTLEREDGQPLGEGLT